jgi:hypothetical protein
MFRVAVFACLCSTSVLPASPIELRQKDVTLVLRADSLTPERKMRLSDSLQLRIVVEGGPKREVVLDSLKADERVWSIQEQAGDPGGRHWERSYTLEPLQPGSLALPVIALRYRDGGDGEWVAVRWADLVLEVLPPAKGGIRLNAPVEDLPETQSAPATFSWWVIPLTLGGVFLLGLAGWWLRQPRRVNGLSPGERAHRELDRLSQAETPVPDQPGWFHSRVSSIVRAYLEERFGFPALRQTTEEVILAARRSDSVGEDVQEDIQSVLQLCDQVKFAGTVPAEGQKADTLTLARRIVERTVKPAG